jgi:hypothetical protein
MQQTYQSELPPLPYITSLDILYGYCYLISIALFVLFVWGTNAHAAADAAASKESADATSPVAASILRRRIDLADRRFQQIGLAGLGAVLILAYIF